MSLSPVSFELTSHATALQDVGSSVPNAVVNLSKSVPWSAFSTSDFSSSGIGNGADARENIVVVTLLGVHLTRSNEPITRPRHYIHKSKDSIPNLHQALG